MGLFKKFKLFGRTRAPQPPDIREILSRDFSDRAVADAYQYCMEKCGWEPLLLRDGPVRDFLLCALFESEVNDGGVSQFFFNSSGDGTIETLAALKKLDPATAAAFEELLDCFPNRTVPKDREARRSLMERLGEDVEKRFDDFDQTLYQHNLSQRCHAFLQAHKNDFLSL